MINIVGIYTTRDTKQPYYWDVVYEWEDQLSASLNVPLISIGKKYDRIYKPSVFKKILNRINFYQTVDKFFFKPSGYFLAFHIGPPGVYSFHSRKDVIPLIIDFWKTEDLQRFESIFSLNRYVGISSREVYEFLMSKNLKLNLQHVPLSLPDRMFALRQKITTKRNFDIVQFGRQNRNLEGYMKALLAEFPEINYVYAQRVNNRLEMVSTINGKLGSFDSRSEFLDLLRNTKICLLSAPGLDDDKVRTGGFSPVTPRFLEGAACGCHLVGIFPDNPDFAYNTIDKICVNVKTYDSFRSTILKCLSSVPQPDHTEYLKSHVTSRTAQTLKEILC
jgi:hypothetical protein